QYNSNNYSARAVVIIGALPDLVVRSVTPTPSARGGDHFSVAWTVANHSPGDVPAGSSWVDGVYLSDHTNPFAQGARSLLLGQVAHSAALAGQGTYDASLDVTLSPSASGQFVVVVADDHNG